MKKKTLKELAEMDKECLSPVDVCGVLNCCPYTLNLTAKQQPQLLGFNWFFAGNRMKIPRVPFLRYMGYEGPINGRDAALMSGA